MGAAERHILSGGLKSARLGLAGSFWAGYLAEARLGTRLREELEDGSKAAAGLTESNRAEV